ncbi:SPOR domain-containing protein, partial [Paracoccus binzhouensis]|uniref:SPOR domain-containing protein n=1 Tax=Paracoccus binzhouensis TaxID=2796149 RepID=UPI0018EED25D
AAPALRQGMAGALQPNRRLCELLGYDGAPGAARPGADATQGYCASTSEADLSRLSFARPLGSRPAAVAEARAEPSAPVAPPPAPQTAPGPGKAAKPAASRVAVADRQGTRKARPADRPADAVGLIPAGARYVQLGTFGNPDNAERAARRLAGLGYPVLRGRDRVNGRPVQFIMAGPFEDRESIVRALDAIRRAGYRDAFPR